MTRAPHVFVVDDDPGIRRLLHRELEAASYSVQDSAAGPAALQAVAERPFDLLILDIDSPASGWEDVIRLVRGVSPLPILALSASDDEDAAARALDYGADDYVQKPFRMKELLARVTNALRRRSLEQGKPARVVSGDLEIDLLYHRVRLHGQPVHLRHKSYEVLRVLAEKAGQVLSHREILSAVWGEGCADRIAYLRVAIRELRLKLEADPAHPRHIVTEAVVGYRLELQQRPGRCNRLAADARDPLG